MKTRYTRAHKLLTKALIQVLILNSLLGFVASRAPVYAQSRPIVVTADQPNVWTLEQAHYLLQQMHRRNLDLKAKSLSDLDANEIAGVRLDVLKTLLEVGVAYNDANRVTNRLLSQNKTYNSERRQALTARRDQLHDESLTLTREISVLKQQQARAATQEEKDRLGTDIETKTAERDAVDKEIEYADNELKTLGDASGDFKETTPEVSFDEKKLPTGLLDDAAKDAFKKVIDNFNDAPKLNASLMLDNFLQMQYEIIAKQLTLLRDEVGAGEQLLFLELPQSVSVTRDNTTNKWAQSWWKIAGYTRYANASTPAAAPTPCVGTATHGNERITGVEQKKVPIRTSQTYEEVQRKTGSTETQQIFEDLENDRSADALGTGMVVDKRSARTVDLIPRQGSVNVNDINLQTHAGALTAVATFLFGFGAKVNYERQREQYSQFVQQELYSAGFGKGAREFGWTFMPMPGTNRLMPGVRTTYAVVIVPKEATTLVLKTAGCYFPRSDSQPANFDTTQTALWKDDGGARGGRSVCSAAKTLLVPVPRRLDRTTDAFNVTKVAYNHVPPGKRITVNVYGEEFPAQLGVLVNGVPLVQSIGVAQPLILDDSRARAALKGDSAIYGEMERVSDSQIVFWFNMPEDFKGTPSITLVAPGLAQELNWLSLKGRCDGITVTADGKQKTQFLQDAAYMFGERTKKDDFRIDSVEAYRSTTRGNLRLVVEGAGFASTGQRMFVNGFELKSFPYISPTLLTGDVPTPSDASIKVTVVNHDVTNGDDTISSEPIPNPAYLKIGNVSVVSYEPAKGKTPATLVVHIEGSGFSDDLRASLGVLVVKSATEAILKIDNPRPAEVVELTDTKTGATVKTIITRKPPANDEQQ